MNRDFYITDNFDKEEYDSLSVGDEKIKTKIDGLLKMTYYIKKYKHNDIVLVLYKNWIIDGSGTTSAIFTGDYDNLREPKGYHSYVDGIVYLNKIIKSEKSYFGCWMNIETEKAIYQTYESRKNYIDYIRKFKLERILN